MSARRAVASAMGDAFCAQARISRAHRVGLGQRTLRRMREQADDLRLELSRLESGLEAAALEQERRTWFYYGWQAGQAAAKGAGRASRS